MKKQTVTEAQPTQTFEEILDSERNRIRSEVASIVNDEIRKVEAFFNTL